MQKRSSCYAVKLICVFAYMGRTFQATAGFQDSDIFQRARKTVLSCIFECDFSPSRIHTLALSYPCA